MTHALSDAPSSAPERHPLRHLAAAGWFCALAIMCSFPLALAPGSQIPGTGPGDNLMFLWNFWWMRQALAHSDASAFNTAYLFAPHGTTLVLHTHTALEAMLGATLFRLLPLTTAHNVVLLAGLAANGLATYALAFREVRRVMPAVFAGTIFASSTYIAIHLLGHFNLVHAWVIPVAVLAWIRSVEHPSPGRCAATAVAFAAATYSDYYYLVYCVMFAIGWSILERWQVGIAGRRFPRAERVLAALACLVSMLIVAISVTGGFRIELAGIPISASNLRNPLAALWLLFLAWVALRCRITSHGGSDRLEDRQNWRWPLAGLGLYLLIILPLAIAAIRMFGSGEYVSPPQHWRTGSRGIDLMTMVLGNPLHPWYGSLTRSAYTRMGIDVMEQVAWIGIVPLAILLSGFWFRPSSDRWRRWTWLTGLFFVWSLGSFLLVGGIDTGLPLPQLFGRMTPILSNARMPGRAIVVVQLGIALLCATQIAHRKWKAPFISVLIAVGLLDTTALPFPMFSTDMSRGVDERIRSSQPGIVLELPFGIRDGLGASGRFDHRALIHQSVHGQPIAGGAVARLPSAIRESYLRTPPFVALMSWPTGKLPADLAIDLKRLGIRYVVVNTDEMDEEIGSVLKERGLRQLMTDGARELYGVD